MPSYSFLDVNAAIVGIGGAINLGAGAGAAEEGISVEYVDAKNTMTMGADGTGMHSLHASSASRVVCTFLKASPANAQLAAMYNLQTVSARTHGSNIISIYNLVSGDAYTCSQVAFGKFPHNLYSKDGRTVSWEFHCVKTDVELGAGNTNSITSPVGI